MALKYIDALVSMASSAGSREVYFPLETDLSAALGTLSQTDDDGGGAPAPASANGAASGRSSGKPQAAGVTNVAQGSKATGRPGGNFSDLD